MAYPTIRTTTVTTSVAGTSHTIQVGSVLQDSLLLLFVGVGTSATISDQVNDFDWAGFTTEIYNSEAVSGLVGDYWVLAKKAGSSEPTTFNVTTSVLTVLTAYCVEITGWHGTVAGGYEFDRTEYATVQTSQDPPSVVAAWGIADTLWLAVGMVSGTEASVTGPSGYALLAEAMASNAADASVSVYYLNQNSSATENPSAFVWPTAREGVALTIAVRPAGGSSVAPLAANYYARLRA